MDIQLILHQNSLRLYHEKPMHQIQCIFHTLHTKTVMYFITLINSLNINTVTETARFQEDKTTAYTATIPVALLK